MYIWSTHLEREVAEDALRISLAMPKGTPTTNKDSFGQRLIALRKERDMTQVQLAKAAQVTQRAIRSSDLSALPCLREHRPRTRILSANASSLSARNAT